MRIEIMLFLMLPFEDLHNLEHILDLMLFYLAHNNIIKRDRKRQGVERMTIDFMPIMHVNKIDILHHSMARKL